MRVCGRWPNRVQGGAMAFFGCVNRMARANLWRRRRRRLHGFLEDYGDSWGGVLGMGAADGLRPRLFFK